MIERHLFCPHVCEPVIQLCTVLDGCDREFDDDFTDIWRRKGSDLFHAKQLLQAIFNNISDFARHFIGTGLRAG